MPNAEVPFFGVEHGNNQILEDAIQEYKRAHTPELIRYTWEAIWTAWGRHIGLNVQVDSLDYSKEEVGELEAENRVLIYVPEELSQQESRYRLFQSFSKMQDDEVEDYHKVGNKIENLAKQFGWMSVEIGRDAPQMDAYHQLIELFINKGLEGQTLNTYIIGAQFSRLITGHYFDDLIPSCSWILLSKDQESDRMFHANFTEDGHLRILRHFPTFDYDKFVGFRSAKRKGKLVNVPILEVALSAIRNHGLEAYYSDSGGAEIIEHFRRLGVLEEIDANGKTSQEVHEDILIRLQNN